jgi:membrane dipeptidase
LMSAGLGHYSRPDKTGEPPVNQLPDHVRGMENATEAMNNVARWLVKNGYSDKEIAKIVGGNALRLLKSVW